MFEFEKTDTYFITIKYGAKIPDGFTYRPYVNMVSFYAEKGESVNQVAKKLRKEIVCNEFPRLKNSPALFAWAVYEMKEAGEDHEYFFPGVKYFSLVNSSAPQLFNDEIPRK